MDNQEDWREKQRVSGKVNHSNAFLSEMANSVFSMGSPDGGIRSLSSLRYCITRLLRTTVSEKGKKFIRDEPKYQYLEMDLRPGKLLSQCVYVKKQGENKQFTQPPSLA